MLEVQVPHLDCPVKRKDKFLTIILSHLKRCYNRLSHSRYFHQAKVAVATFSLISEVVFQSPAHRENKFYLLTASEHLHVLVKSRKCRRGAYEFPNHGIAELAYKKKTF